MPVEQINRTALFYEENGDGEPLLLVHGAWVDHTDWDAVAPRLAEAHRVVTYDLRGHGQSAVEPPDAGTVHDDVADLAALIDHLDLGPANVAGISSGACIALRLAIEHPTLVRRVLPHEPPIVALLLDDPNNEAILDEFGGTIAEVQARIEAGDHRGAAQRFFDDLVLDPWDDMPAALQERIASHAVAFVGQMRDADAIALDPTALGAVSLPVLLSEGEESHELFRRVAERGAALMPNARRVTIPAGGHVPHRTHPDAYVDMVLEFIRSTRSSLASDVEI
jgi:pimeloyl-ACP methyl ester carboxylesterase